MAARVRGRTDLLLNLAGPQAQQESALGQETGGEMCHVKQARSNSKTNDQDSLFKVEYLHRSPSQLPADPLLLSLSVAAALARVACVHLPAVEGEHEAGLAGEGADAEALGLEP